ncbi:MAG: hypothetical protein KAR08_01640, partial [Candidatus Heimdallarchaeota archaeon]|nr:hypothetical protein [Candidatus Heimdallarchaeota archaeon]
DVFPHTTALDPLSWTPLLWDTSYQDMAYYDIGDTEFHYGAPADFEDFHTFKTESVYDAQWTQQIYGGMVERNPAAPYLNAYGPYLADSFTSSNGINYSVILNSDAKFADGVVCDSADVKYSYDLLINVDFGQPDYGFYSDYINTNTIKIVSQFEVDVDFIQAYVFQDSNLAVDILPEHIWSSILPENQENMAVTWAADDVLDSQKIIGIGPYYLHDYDGTNGVLHLKANTYWDDWGGHATQLIDDLYFEFWSNKEGALSALAAGTLDMVDSQFSPQLNEIPATVDYVMVSSPGSQEMGFNCMHPILGTGELCPISSPESGKHIRKAISYLIPRNRIIEENLNGIGDPGITPFPRAAVGFDESLEPLQYSTSLALQHMKMAGYDITAFFVGTSTNVGLGLVTVISILALIGGCYYYKRKKTHPE